MTKLFSETTKIVFVSDMFAENYLGGAELTLKALIDSSPVEVFKLKSQDVSIEHIKQGIQLYWIFGNYTQLNPELLPVIAQNLNYSIVECDYKFCRYRSIERHYLETGQRCDCHEQQHGNLIASFMSAADHTWWMSEAQRDQYCSRFNFLVDYHQGVLSSVFDDEFFHQLNALRAEGICDQKNENWIILDSQSWIKDTANTKKFAEERNMPYELVGNVSYADMLLKLAGSKGLIFMPSGMDTCPRLVIEAKLLGCELILNDNVQHANESWFDTSDIASIEDYLKSSRDIFWTETLRHIERDYTLSGYTTTYNCVKQEYPFEACIESLLGFCDEVVVVDAGSTDNTLLKLCSLQQKYALVDIPDEKKSYGALVNIINAQNPMSRLKVHVVERDWTDPRSALFDGMQKAEARQRCTSDFVWQQDVDEVVRSEDFVKIKELIKNFPKAVPMLSLPVVEYWGGFDKVRLDITPWKWRLSRNSPRITHGIPVHLRAKDEQGREIALPGTDGCDPIDANTGEQIVFLGFLTNEADKLRQQALVGDEEARLAYERWFINVVSNVPSVYHASWLNIERKIRLYRDFWTRHWNVLEGKEYEDTADTNMFFDKNWKDVTDADIQQLARRLKTETGGHVFHSKWNGKYTPWMTLPIAPPKFS
jgi:glycosyltransferase involved in cell wall biosynthesis